ncbi:MAG: phosphate/phosphite/phosphonate ABC transporter substrate-binding protein, partial [Desulfobacteraceae bacterium]|nr:phosphate/phosphite/phosphonate ABC transporter substrate-binding protein [Desulfobacteraceae bacterium]
MKKMFISILAISIIFLSNFCFGETSYKIGVLAKNGPVKALKMWKSTGEYLSGKVAGNFEIVPLDFDAVFPAIEKGAVDFFLVNSSMFITAKVKYGAKAVATMINSRQGKPLKSFGGVIFTSEENDEINSVNDLSGKTFMAVKKSSFGGWQMAYMELLNLGIDPLKDFSKFEFGGKHDNVVLAIQNGVVDAGTVRTDTLERMAAAGTIELSEFKILSQKK